MMRFRNRRRGTYSRGFTLVELMIAVVLIAVLAALSVPTISSSMERNRTAQLNRDIANSFLSTRSHAMRHGQAMFVDVNVGADSEIVFYEPANMGEANSCVLADDDGPQDTGDVLRRIRPENYGVEIEFQQVMPAGTQRLCISPTGQVVSPAGIPIQAADSLEEDCGRMNFVLSMWHVDGEGLGGCDVDEATEVQRDIHNFSMIHVAQGGQVRVIR